jgi:hypothetical protein
MVSLRQFDFTRIPYDVIQWEINRFLEPCDRAAFNTVMEWPERTYKRFPKGFADMHAYKIAYATQRRYAFLLNYLTDKAANSYFDSNIIKAKTKIMVKYAEFFSKQVALPLFKHRPENRQRVISELENALSEDSDLLDFMTLENHATLLHTIDYVKGVTL